MGVSINSGMADLVVEWLDFDAAKKKMIAWLEKHQKGKAYRHL